MVSKEAVELLLQELAMLLELIELPGEELSTSLSMEGVNRWWAEIGNDRRCLLISMASPGFSSHSVYKCLTLFTARGQGWEVGVIKGVKSEGSRVGGNDGGGVKGEETKELV